MQSTPRQSNQSKHSGSISGLVVCVVLLGVSALLWLNQQSIIDSIKFWQYQPSPAIASIASRADLTDKGEFIFYATHPSVEGGQTFNSKCDRKEQNTAVLGCYINDNIYIFDVTDNRLDGIEEVTASHEMLHAVYQRLSDDERQRINALVEEEFKKLLFDPSLQERMAFYERTEPGERDNELHSIIGTEIASISTELEQHYAKYFTDRSKIVELHSKYSSVFTSLSDEAKSLSSELDTLAASIKTASSKYNADAAQLNKDISDFNARASSGDFDSQTQFSRERQLLADRVKSLAVSRNSVNQLIERYNTLREQYNSTVTQSNELYKSIDSSLAPAPKV